MKRLNVYLFITLILGVLQLNAQETRYLDQVFDQVERTPNVMYGTNISVLTGAPQQVDLFMDVYEPAGDDETNRPVVIYLHTGSYLPQYINGQITGSRLDSTVVEVCTRLAKMGYVAIAASYRLGWNPAAVGPEGQDVRTGTLLNAVYRSIQDIRGLTRFLRKTVAVDGNPYGVDTDKITLWGQGTGGYIVYGSAFLDRYEEVVLDKFISSQTLLPYVDTTLNGNVYGTTQKPLCIPNFPNYSSDFRLGVNMGGALGDISWIEGDASPIDEPNIIGFHVVTDPFAPFGNGPVIVPTTGDFVVNVSGTRTATARVNELGSNSEMDAVFAIDPASFPLQAFQNAYVDALKPVPFQFPGQEATTLATDHIYPHVPPGLRVESGPWDWWNKAQLDAVIAAINSQIPDPEDHFDADELDSNGKLTNPDMSPEKARRYLDTIMAYFAPRACLALGLEECLMVGTEEVINPATVDMLIGPNPGTDYINLQSNAEHPMLEVYLFDIAGRMVQSNFSIDGHQYQIKRGNLPNGMYIAKVRFKEGYVVQRVVFE